MNDTLATDEHLQELNLDIEELQAILNDHVKRPRVKQLLDPILEKMQRGKIEMEKILEASAPKKLEKVPEENKEGEKSQDPVDYALSEIAKMNFQTISKYAWE